MPRNKDKKSNGSTAKGASKRARHKRKRAEQAAGIERLNSVHYLRLRIQPSMHHRIG